MHFVGPRPCGDIISCSFVLFAFLGWIKNILEDAPNSFQACAVATEYLKCD